MPARTSVAHESAPGSFDSHESSVVTYRSELMYSWRTARRGVITRDAGVGRLPNGCFAALRPVRTCRCAGGATLAPPAPMLATL